MSLSALADCDTELRGRRLGADDYVTKPIDFDRLLFIIDARIARSRLPPKIVKLNERGLIKP